MSTYPETLCCPYCNQKLQNYIAPDFISECCGKLIAVREEQVKHVQVFIPPTLPLSCIGNNDANKPIKGVTVRDANRGRESRWTHVYYSAGWYVRITGGFDLEKAGLPHGLSMGHVFSTAKEAQEYANMVDRILDLIVMRVVEEAAEQVGKEILEQLQ